jgi:hypothetical protein
MLVINLTTKTKPSDVIFVSKKGKEITASYVEGRRGCGARFGG